MGGDTKHLMKWVGGGWYITLNGMERVGEMRWMSGSGGVHYCK